MKLPSSTSKLLALQEATNVELNVRLSEIFKRYRGTAFLARNDNLFTEHWTPEVAAAGYDFDGFEIKDKDIVLNGVEYTSGFIYRISVTLPLELMDNAQAIEAYFQRHYAEIKTNSELSAATSADPRQINFPAR